MVKKVIISAVVLFFLGHSSMLMMDVILIKKIINPDKFDQIQTNLTYLDTVSKWQRRLSLGLYSLPYFNEMDEIVFNTIDLGHQGLRLFQTIEISLNKSINGIEVAESDWDEIFEQSQKISTKLDGIIRIVKSNRVKQIFRWTSQTKQYLVVNNHLINVKNGLKEVDVSWVQIKHFLGYYNKTHTIVLTQNNMELWPTGGYLGSYAEFFMEKGAMKQLKFQDIGVPNGQIKGYVEAPLPISKYVHNGQTPGWKLRESNWNPDFPKAMKEIEWFFVEGGVEPIDYMVAVNLIPIEDLISEIGTVNVLDYDLELTADNFYEVTQTQTSYDFFDGSTQKRDYLNALGREIINLVINQPQKMIPALSKVVVKNIVDKQILISAKDEETAIQLRKLNWDGALGEIGQTDYLHINETNVGINKTNCCIDRTVADVITFEDDRIRHQLSLNFVNNNPPKPNPPAVWGGGYKVYIRLYVPQEATLESISENGQQLDMSQIDESEYEDKQVIGFLGLIPGVEAKSYQVLYSLPNVYHDNYGLKLVKQSGINLVDWKITVVNGEKTTRYDFDLRGDLIVWPQYFENQITHESVDDKE